MSPVWLCTGAVDGGFENISSSMRLNGFCSSTSLHPAIQDYGKLKRGNTKKETQGGGLGLIGYLFIYLFKLAKKTFFFSLKSVKGMNCSSVW